MGGNKLPDISIVSSWSIPLIILIILIYGIIKKVKIYDLFTEGAAEGIKTVINVFPYILAMLIAINVFQVSGALEILIDILKPLSDKFNIPDQVMPLMFLRPLSGSGSLSYTNQLLKTHGVDSFIGILASTIQGSTETTFYIIAVYFGSIGIKKYRYAVTVGLFADLTGFFASIFICKLLFL